MNESNEKKLVIVWLSVDKQAAIDMALLYARDSLINGWWNQIELILWGPSVESARRKRGGPAGTGAASEPRRSDRNLSRMRGALRRLTEALRPWF